MTNDYKKQCRIIFIVIGLIYLVAWGSALLDTRLTAHQQHSNISQLVIFGLAYGAILIAIYRQQIWTQLQSWQKSYHRRKKEPNSETGRQLLAGGIFGIICYQFGRSLSGHSLALWPQKAIIAPIFLAFLVLTVYFFGRGFRSWLEEK